MSQFDDEADDKGAALRGGASVSRRQTLRLGAAALAALPLGAARGAAPALPRLRRGGSIHTALNWAALAGPGADRVGPYLWPPFGAANYRLDPAFLAAMRGAGLDFVRLTVDPGPLLESSGARRTEALAIVLDRCRAIHKAGLDVIVDLHPNNQVAEHAPARIVDDPTGAAFSRYALMVGALAGALKALDPARVALEPMNEPPYGYDFASAQRWRRMLGELKQSARAAHNALTLVLSGAAGGGIRGLLGVDASGLDDERIVWSFHYYDPHPFTHQGVRTSQKELLHYRYLTDLPWPANARPPTFIGEAIDTAAKLDTQTNPALRETLRRAARETARAYLASGADAQTIATDFGKVADWAGRHAIPAQRILLGEFGAARRIVNGSESADREAWLAAVRGEAERRGYGWALWDVNQPEMGLVSLRGATTLDPGMVKALGLRG